MEREEGDEPAGKRARICAQSPTLCAVQGGVEELAAQTATCGSAEPSRDLRLPSFLSDLFAETEASALQPLPDSAASTDPVSLSAYVSQAKKERKQDERYGPYGAPPPSMDAKNPLLPFSLRVKLQQRVFEEPFGKPLLESEVSSLTRQFWPKGWPSNRDRLEVVLDHTMRLLVEVLYHCCGRGRLRLALAAPRSLRVASLAVFDTSALLFCTRKRCKGGVVRVIQDARAVFGCVTVPPVVLQELQHQAEGINAPKDVRVTNYKRPSDVADLKEAALEVLRQLDAALSEQAEGQPWLRVNWPMGVVCSNAAQVVPHWRRNVINDDYLLVSAQRAAADIAGVAGLLSNDRRLLKRTLEVSGVIGINMKEFSGVANRSAPSEKTIDDSIAAYERTLRTVDNAPARYAARRAAAADMAAGLPQAEAGAEAEELAEERSLESGELEEEC